MEINLKPSIQLRLYRLFGIIQWPLFTVVVLGSALFLAWQLLAHMNFLYPLWYENLDIDQVIATYGPQNRHRSRFEDTTKAERTRLFAAIVKAIHNHGRDLDTLIYHDPAGRPIAALLTESEITHLQDVAHLLESLLPWGQNATLLLPLLVSILLWQKRNKPPVTKILLGLAISLSTAVSLILILGPVEVFYNLHTRLFPEDHRWFFYYQDSLMTMLMKAPVIFGYIAVSLATLTLLLTVGIVFLVHQLYQWIYSTHPSA